MKRKTWVCVAVAISFGVALVPQIPAEAAGCGSWIKTAERRTGSGQAAAGSCSTTSSTWSTADNPGGDGQFPTVAAGRDLSPSGENVPHGHLSGWQQIYSDDFPTDVALGDFPQAVSNKWATYHDGWKDTSGQGTYAPSKVISIEDGVMNLYLHTENGRHLVAAPLPKVPGPGGPGAGMRYGKYSIRFRSDYLPGYKIAWLLWPDSNRWMDGEIDFPEGNLNRKLYAFMHYRQQPWNQYALPLPDNAFNTWHTASIEWTPTEVRFLLDNEIVGRTRDRNKIPNTPMHWVLQTETSPYFEVEDHVHGRVQIDWVAAYRRR